VLSACSTAFAMLRSCVTRDEQGRLSALHAASFKKSVIVIFIYAASIPLAFVSVYLSMAIFVFIPAIYFLPDLREVE
jgi:uncharacterized membrane protein